MNAARHFDLDIATEDPVHEHHAPRHDPTAGLTDQQRAAFQALDRFAQGQTEHGMAVLRGFAGTGKTFLVARLIQALEDAGLAIAIAAPTNKAVRVLREKIVQAGVAMPDAPIDQQDPRGAASTVAFGSLHSLLGLKLTEREDGTQECQSARDPSLHAYDLAIVDECSMIGSDLFARVVTAKRGCRVLFVGDPAQLPPIEPGEAISPTFSKVTFEVTLSEVVRQARDNPIIQLSMLIRRAIESDHDVTAADMAAVLPPLHDSPAAALVTGGPETVSAFALFEIRAGRDARVLAFTNAAVQQYNGAIHEALHGRTEFPFVPGEPVILHAACEAQVLDAQGRFTGIKTTLITSEEAAVIAVAPREHPDWPQVPCAAVILERDGGQQVQVFVATQASALERTIAEQFTVWRTLKARAEAAYQQGLRAEGRRLQDQAKEASARAWALRKAFAPLRHAYALTTHKSQGSTFDTAIVDLADMARMRSAFQFNRGLYVAATRPRQYLAIVA